MPPKWEYKREGWRKNENPVYEHHLRREESPCHAGTGTTTPALWQWDAECFKTTPWVLKQTRGNFIVALQYVSFYRKQRNTKYSTHTYKKNKIQELRKRKTSLWEPKIISRPITSIRSSQLRVPANVATTPGPYDEKELLKDTRLAYWVFSQIYSNGLFTLHASNEAVFTVYTMLQSRIFLGGGWGGDRWLKYPDTNFDFLMT